MSNHSSNIKLLIEQWKLGHKDAEQDLYQFAYSHLYKLAQQERKKSASKHGQNNKVLWDGTNNTTALVHDTYLKLSTADINTIIDTRNFLLMAAKIMRQILIDSARRQYAQKRQAPKEPQPLDKRPFEQLIIMDKAIDSFAESYPRQSNALKLKYLIGLKNKEISQLLTCSTSLIEKDLKFSICWLNRKLNPSNTHEIE